VWDDQKKWDDQRYIHLKHSGIVKQLTPLLEKKDEVLKYKLLKIIEICDLRELEKTVFGLVKKQAISDGLQFQAIQWIVQNQKIPCGYEINLTTSNTQNGYRRYKGH